MRVCLQPGLVPGSGLFPAVAPEGGSGLPGCMWVWLVQGLRGVAGPGGTLSGVWQEGTGVAECGVQGVPPLNWSIP